MNRRVFAAFAYPLLLTALLFGGSLAYDVYGYRFSFMHTQTPGSLTQRLLQQTFTKVYPEVQTGDHLRYGLRKVDDQRYEVTLINTTARPFRIQMYESFETKNEQLKDSLVIHYALTTEYVKNGITVLPARRFFDCGTGLGFYTIRPYEKFRYVINLEQKFSRANAPQATISYRAPGRYLDLLTGKLIADPPMISNGNNAPTPDFAKLNLRPEDLMLRFVLYYRAFDGSAAYRTVSEAIPLQRRGGTLADPI